METIGQPQNLDLPIAKFIVRVTGTLILDLVGSLL